MQIIIQDKAAKFIKSKGHDSIELWLEGCSSWGVGEPQPSVKMGAPTNLEDYDKYETDGINVYVSVDVNAKNDELKVNYSKILWSEKLTVEGMAF